MKKAKTCQLKAESQRMESITIVLKASNTTINTAKKAKIKIEKTKINIKRVDNLFSILFIFFTDTSSAASAAASAAAAADSLSLFFSDLPTSVDPLAMSRLRTLDIFDENSKYKTSEYFKTLTLKYQMSRVSQIMMKNLQILSEICWFSDVVDESTENENLYTKNLIQKIKEDLI
ncbi:predicted protein [Histoplasma capsulatum H143]|uniref:Uncharacterized protein n=1 Tax=Ajellomyces capsulatus (strain H143) TaxID=544712 RepID=C6HPM0_AJECH|nr:predicted protein [Histoplasma capsulatum H143]